MRGAFRFGDESDSRHLWSIRMDKAPRPLIRAIRMGIARYSP
jgi:hypothetical protein